MFSYIHIPFCESKCKYCRFASLWNLNQVLVEQYLWHLCKNIDNYKRPVENAGLLHSIYFWWWTPSILSKWQFEKILYSMKQKFNFSENIEITLETTPNNVHKENIEIWKQLWINRISMWVQTLNQKTLQEIKRSPAEVIFTALNLMTQHFDNISIDFIIWLPYVQKWEIYKNIEYVLKNYTSLKHISVYMLEDYYIPEINNSKFDQITYPNTWNQLWIDEKYFIDEYLEIKKLLTDAGFTRYEFSNFAKKWYECKHNIAYWNHSDVIWFWLWAHSLVNKYRFAYKDDFLWYYKWEYEYQEYLSDENIFLEQIMFGFRRNGISQKLYTQLSQKKITQYIENQVLFMDNNSLKIAEKYLHMMDHIILELIS